MKEYCRDFIALATNAPEIPEKVLEMSFMIGLKSKIRAGVKMFEPRNLKKMMSMAKMVEEWNGTMDGSPEHSTVGMSKTNRSGPQRPMTHYSNSGVEPYNNKPKPTSNMERQVM